MERRRDCCPCATTVRFAFVDRSKAPARFFLRREATFVVRRVDTRGQRGLGEKQGRGYEGRVRTRTLSGSTTACNSSYRIS